MRTTHLDRAPDANPDEWLRAFQEDVRAEEERERAAMEDGTVYAIGAIGTPLVKIGHTLSTPQSRIDDMQTGCPMLLEHLASWPGGRTCESFIHDMLTRFQLRYRAEWFYLVDFDTIRSTSGMKAAEIGLALANGFVAQNGGWEAVFERIQAQMREAIHA